MTPLRISQVLLYQEFDTVKKMATKVNFLSPYDPKKPIYLQTDGSKSNLRYLLSQNGDEETTQPAEGESEETKKRNLSEEESYLWE